MDRRCGRVFVVADRRRARVITDGVALCLPGAPTSALTRHPPNQRLPRRPTHPPPFLPGHLAHGLELLSFLLSSGTLTSSSRPFLSLPFVGVNMPSIHLSRGPFNIKSQVPPRPAASKCHELGGMAPHTLPDARSPTTQPDNR